MRLPPGLLVAAILTLPLAAHAQATTEPEIRAATGFIDAEGREWLPSGSPGIPLGTTTPTLFMDSKCNVLTGVCDDGLHWASASEVAQMIAEVTGEPITSQSTDGAAAIAIESALGNNLWPGEFDSIYSGVTRDDYRLNVSVKSDMLPPYTLTGSGGYSFGQCQDFNACNDEDTTALVWIPVPEPAPLGLMGAGLAAVYFMRRRRIAESMRT